MGNEEHASDLFVGLVGFPDSPFHFEFAFGVVYEGSGYFEAVHFEGAVEVVQGGFWGNEGMKKVLNPKKADKCEFQGTVDPLREP